jgi:hypothetical protein
LKCDVNIFLLAKSLFFRLSVPIWEQRFRRNLGLASFDPVIPYYGGARIGSKESKSPISLSFTATPLNDFIGIAAVR